MSNQVREFVLRGESATLALGGLMAARCDGGLTVYLYGELGAGKTTWVRGFLRELGHVGTVKSPTYTLVEVYQVGARSVFHFDLYRLSDAEELEYMGIRDYWGEENLRIIEWPERGQPLLPAPDIDIRISYAGQDARQVRLAARTPRGESILRDIKVETIG